MPVHVRQGLALIGFGALLAFMGLIWVANLFGVAEEHARRIAANRSNRMVARWLGEEDRLNGDPMNHPGMKLGRFTAGFGFMLFGLVLAISGIVHLASPSE